MFSALLLALTLTAGQQNVAQPGQRFAWDFKTADVATFGITEFQTQIDGGAWTSVGMATVIGSDATAGVTSYATAIPALIPGTHTFTVRACAGTALCSDAATPALSFVMFVKPPAPSGPRVVGGGVGVGGQ